MGVLVLSGSGSLVVCAAAHNLALGVSVSAKVHKLPAAAAA